MIIADARLKIIAVIASASVMLLFALVTMAVLIPMLVGVALVLLGLATEYRPAAVVGALIVLTMAALSVELVTLTEVGGVVVATAALFIPSLLILWAALSSEPGDPYELRVRTRPFYRLVAVGAACVLSVPVFALVLGAVLPTVAMSVSTMAEMSVLVLATALMALVFARSSPTAATDEVPAPGPGELDTEPAAKKH